MKDIFGQEVKEGEQVAYNSYGRKGSLKVGFIRRITKKGISVQTPSQWRWEQEHPGQPGVGFYAVAEGQFVRSPVQ